MVTINRIGGGAAISVQPTAVQPQGQSVLGTVRAALDFVGRKLGLIKASAPSVDREQTPKLMPGAGQKARITAADRKAYREAGRQVRQMHQRQLGTGGLAGRMAQASAQQGLAVATAQRLERGEALDSKGLAREAMQITRPLRGAVREVRRAEVKLSASRNQGTMHAAASKYSVPLSRKGMSSASIKQLNKAAQDHALQHSGKLTPKQAEAAFKALMQQHYKQHGGWH